MLLCGEVHYFRAPRELWRDRLVKLKAAGLNCVTTYFAWNYHEVEPGLFDVRGEKDFAAYIEEAASLGLGVVARPGPYICSEWDNGGFPDWLIKEGWVPRSLEDLPAEERWLRFVLPIIAKYSAKRSGPVVAVQLENEYFWGDIPYHQALKEIAEEVGIDVPIYTNANRYARNAGFIDSLDLYPDPWDLDRVVEAFEDMRATQPGPVKIMEYEGGWFTRIDKPLPTERGHFPAEWTQALLAAALAYGADLISFYMFHGGTNFAYWTGRWIATTYDYEAAVREWGELSDRFYKIRLLAYLRDLLEGSEEEVVEYSSRRLRAVRRLRRGGSLAFYVNASDEPWVVDGVEIPPKSAAVLPRGVVANGLALTSNLSLMAIVGDTAVLYGDRGRVFSARIEGASAYRCYGVEASLSGNALEVRGVVDGVRGCVVEGPLGRLRVLFLPVEVAERTWLVEGRLIPSTAYFLRGEGEGGALVFELKGDAEVYLPGRSAAGEYVEELEMTRIRLSASPEPPRVEVLGVAARPLAPRPIMALDAAKPLEALGVYKHDYYAYLFDVPAPREYRIRVNDYAVVLSRGPAAAGALWLSAGLEAGEAVVVAESTGHPNDGLAPHFTGLLAPLLHKPSGSAELVFEYGVVELGEYRPGLAAAHSRTALLNRRIFEMVPREWGPAQELREFTGVIYARARFMRAGKYAVLRITRSSPALGGWRIFGVLVNGRRAYLGRDGVIYVPPELLKDGENEVVVAWPEYGFSGRPEVEAVVEFYDGAVEPKALAVLEPAGELRQAGLPLELEGPAEVVVKFKASARPDVVAPLYLELEGEFNAQIFLNGRLIGRYYGEGSQRRFYLPEPYLAEVNEVRLRALPLRPRARLSASIGAYFAAQVVELKP